MRRWKPEPVKDATWLCELCKEFRNSGSQKACRTCGAKRKKSRFVVRLDGAVYLCHVFSKRRMHLLTALRISPSPDVVLKINLNGRTDITIDSVTDILKNAIRTGNTDFDTISENQSSIVSQNSLFDQVLREGTRVVYHPAIGRFVDADLSPVAQHQDAADKANDAFSVTDTLSFADSAELSYVRSMDQTKLLVKKIVSETIAHRTEEDKSAIVFDDRTSIERAECGICEFNFPVSSLLSKMSFKAIAQWRSDHGAPIPASDKRLLKTRIYDNTPICLFCSQFFEINVFENVEKEREHMKNEVPKIQKSSASSQNPVLARPLSRIGRQLEISNLKMRSVAVPRASTGPSKSASVAVLEVKAKTNSSLMKSMRELAKMEKEEREAKARSASRAKSKSPARAKSQSPPRRTAPAEILRSRIEKQRAMLAAVSSTYQQDESPQKPMKVFRPRAKSSPTKVRKSLSGTGQEEVQQGDNFLDDLVSAKQELKSQIASLLEQKKLQQRESSPSRVTFQEGDFTMTRRKSPVRGASPTRSAPGSANKEHRPVWIDTSASVSGVFPSLNELRRRIMSHPSSKPLKKEEGEGEGAQTPKKSSTPKSKAKKATGKPANRKSNGKKKVGANNKKRLQRAKRLVKNAATAYMGPVVDEVMDELGFKGVEDLPPEDEHPETTSSPSSRRRINKPAPEGDSIISRKEHAKSKGSPSKEKASPSKVPQAPISGILKKPVIGVPTKSSPDAKSAPPKGDPVPDPYEDGDDYYTNEFEDDVQGPGSAAMPTKSSKRAVNISQPKNAYEDGDDFYAEEFEDDDQNTGGNGNIARSPQKSGLKNLAPTASTGDGASGASRAKEASSAPSAKAAEDEDVYGQEDFEVDDNLVGHAFFLTTHPAPNDLRTQAGNSPKGGMVALNESKFDVEERLTTNRQNSRGSAFNPSIELMGDRQFVTSRGRTPTSRGKSSRRRRRHVGTPGSPSGAVSRAEIHSPMAEPPQNLGDDEYGYLDDFEADMDHPRRESDALSARVLSPQAPKRVTFSPITTKEKASLDLGTMKEMKSMDSFGEEINADALRVSYKVLRSLPDSAADIETPLDPKAKNSMNAFISSLFELKEGERDLDVYGEEEEEQVDFDAEPSSKNPSRSVSLLASTSFADDGDGESTRAERRAPKDRAGAMLPRGVAIAKMAFARREEELINANKIFEAGITTRTRAVLPHIVKDVKGYPSQLDLRIMKASGELAPKREEKVVEKKDDFAEKIRQFTKKNQAKAAAASSGPSAAGGSGAAGNKMVSKKR